MLAEIEMRRELVRRQIDLSILRHLGEVSQPLDLLPLQFVQLRPDSRVHQFQMPDHRARSDVLGRGLLELLTELGVALQSTNHLLKVPATEGGEKS